LAQSESPRSPSASVSGATRSSGRPIHTASWGCPSVSATEGTANPSKNRGAARRRGCKIDLECNLK
jgi:hypothetical protein